MMENRMKIVRIASMAIALCVASASVAAAQGRPDSAPPRRGQMGGRLLDGITLSDSQQAQLKVIREKYVPKRMELMQAVRATGAPPDSATRAKMMELQTSYNAEIRAILTTDQQVVFDKNIADEKERRAKMAPPPGN